MIMKITHSQDSFKTAYRTFYEVKRIDQPIWSTELDHEVWDVTYCPIEKRCGAWCELLDYMEHQ